MQTLADFVGVGRRFQKAIRVDADTAGSGALEGYVFSPSAAETLKHMAAQVAETGQGAFTWTGPYGGGKSSLALVLASLVGDHAEERKLARKLIGPRVADEVSRYLDATGKGRVVVPVMGRRADPQTAILEAIRERVPASKRRRNEGTALAALRAIADASAGGLLLVIDEMAKFLEYAARDEGDVYFFQQLAEEASRSGGKLLVVGILHQAFDDYAHKLAREVRDEWLKVQGRFADIPLHVAAEEQVELISRAIEVRNGKRPDIRHAREFAATIRRPRGEDQNLFVERLHRCWPLDPAVACLLGPLSRRRFGQNQRSIFGFLNSAEPFGFQSFLRETRAGAATFDLPRLWDYLRANLEPSILASPDGHRWALAVDSLERCEARGGDADHVAAVKSIALIDLFKDRSVLSASPKTLEASLTAIKPKRLSEVLADLTDWSIIIFKKHLGAYAIYAGSDFDIEGAILEARAKMTGLDFRRLRSIAMLQPILAKRFYHETGSLVWFDVDVAPLSSVAETLAGYKPANGSTGLFLLLIGTEAENAQQAARALGGAVRSERRFPLGIGWSRNNYAIREAAIELLALEAVRSGRSELNGDAVARREVAARIARAAADLEDKLREAFVSAQWNTNVAGVDWGTDGCAAHAGAASLNIMASRLADAWFHKIPVIHNELLNRIKPSSNANAAQKALLRAMIEHTREARLGIDGYPAEGGLYAALLERPGLHGPNPDNAGTFRFLPPDPANESRLAGLWEVADEKVRGGTSANVSMAEIFLAWKAAPYGVRDGLLVVLGVAFVLSRLEHLSVYLDGVYQVRPTAMIADRLLQDWGAVTLRWHELSDVQRTALSGLADVVAENRGFEQEVTCRSPTPLDIAKGLVRLVNDLPPWVLRTATLPERAAHVRNLGKIANDPNKFLLDDLPAVVGSKTNLEDPSRIVGFVSEGLKTLLSAYPAMMGELEAAMLAELRVRLEGKPDPIGCLRERAATIRGLTGNYRLDAFATRLMTYDLTKENIEAFEGIAALAANKPTRDWLDRDVDHARIELASLAQEFVKAEGFAHVKGRNDGRLSLAIYSSDPRKDVPVRAEADITTAENGEVIALAEEVLALLEAKGISRDAQLGVIAEVGARLAETGDARAPGTGRRRRKIA
jgi:hypothetical protein